MASASFTDACVHIRTPVYNGRFCLPRQKAHMVFSKINPLIVDKRHFSLSRVRNSHRLPAYELWLSPYFLTKTANDLQSFYLTLRPSGSVAIKAHGFHCRVLKKYLLTERFNDREVSFFYSCG